MKFTLTIELSNETHGRLGKVDVETALQDVARSFHAEGFAMPAKGKAHLLDGLEVGKWEIVEEPKPQAEKSLCIHCGIRIHRTTEAERHGLIDQSGSEWKHDDGFWFCGNGNDKAEGLD